MPMDPMSPIRASERISIAWGGRPAAEDTDTLVLTVDGVSVDLRVFIEGPSVGTIDWASVGAVGHGKGHSDCESSRAKVTCCASLCSRSRQPPPC